MNVLSLFDGIGCGMEALLRAGISVDRYLASEIDERAITVCLSNHPSVERLGDVVSVVGSRLPIVDLLIGGSPCQGLSSIGVGLGLDDPRSGLYHEFVRLLNETSPRWFLLENVPMRADICDRISSDLGVQPITIDSALVSAQRRRRLYWTNIPTTQPHDRGIDIHDVIDMSITEKPVGGAWRGRVPSNDPEFVDPFNRSEVRGKTTTLRTNVHNGCTWVRMPDGRYRNMTVSEFEVLQTLPVGYTGVVKPTVAKRLIANGWTVDVVSHILSGMEE